MYIASSGRAQIQSQSADTEQPGSATTVVDTGGAAQTGSAAGTPLEDNGGSALVEEAAALADAGKSNTAAGVDFILRVVGPTTLVVIHPEARGTDGHWLDESNIDEAAAWVEQQNAAGFNIYFTLNLPRHGVSKKPAKADIQTIRGVAADVDAKGGRTMEQALEAIQRLPAPPTFIIMTGGGYQPVWLLGAPLQASPDVVHRAESLGKRIRDAVGGDDMQSVEHIFRVPFTTNYPNQTKRDAGRVPCVASVVQARGVQ